MILSRFFSARWLPVLRVVSLGLFLSAQAAVAIHSHAPAMSPDKAAWAASSSDAHAVPCRTCELAGQTRAFLHNAAAFAAAPVREEAFRTSVAASTVASAPILLAARAPPAC
jgi:hypothetical protein